jgi:single-strand DNA-binding protein
MTSFNKVILLGNLTRDPEVRYTPNGSAVASFSIAVNRKYKQGDETREEVSYIDIVVFGKQAENCGQYLNKGDAALIEGAAAAPVGRQGHRQNRSKVEVAASVIVHAEVTASGGGQPGGAGPEPRLMRAISPFKAVFQIHPLTMMSQLWQNLLQDHPAQSVHPRPQPTAPAGPVTAAMRGPDQKKGFTVRRKVCRFCVDKAPFIDYKDIKTLRFFITERGKILPRRISGNCARHQRDVTVAIQRGRNIAILPFSGEK